MNTLLIEIYARGNLDMFCLSLLCLRLFSLYNLDYKFALGYDFCAIQIFQNWFLSVKSSQILTTEKEDLHNKIAILINKGQWNFHWHVYTSLHIETLQYTNTRQCLLMEFSCYHFSPMTMSKEKIYHELFLMSKFSGYMCNQM